MGLPRPTEVTSRTKASATTFGLWGRVAITVAVGLVSLYNVSMLLGGALVLLPIVVCWIGFAVVVLRQVWKAVPVDDAFAAPKVRAVDIWRAGTAPSEKDAPRLTNAMIAWRIVVGLTLLTAFVAFRTGPNEVKAAVMATASIVGLYAFFRGFLSR